MFVSRAVLLAAVLCSVCAFAKKDHATSGRAKISADAPTAPSGLYLIPDDATPDLALRLLEANAAKVSTETDPGKKNPMHAELGRVIATLIERKKLDPATLPYDVLALADGSETKHTLLEARLLADVGKPPGRLDENVTHRWLKNQALALMGTEPQIAEAALRLYFLHATPHLTWAHYSSAWVRDRLKELAGVAATSPFKLEPLPEGHDRAAIAATLEENIRHIYGLAAEMQHSHLTKHPFREKYILIHHIVAPWTAEVDCHEDVGCWRNTMLMMMAKEWSAMFDEAHARLGGKLSEMPIDALVLHDRFERLRASARLSGETSSRTRPGLLFAKHLGDLLRAEPKLAHYTAAGFVDHDFSPVNELRHPYLYDEVKGLAEQYREKNPRLAEALAVTAARLKEDTDVEIDRNHSDYPFDGRRFMARDAMARLAKPHSPLLPAYPTVDYVGTNRSDMAAAKKNADRLLAHAAVVGDRVHEVMRWLESWDPKKRNADEIRREMRERFPDHFVGDFDIEKARVHLLGELRAQFDERYRLLIVQGQTYEVVVNRIEFPLDFHATADRLLAHRLPYGLGGQFDRGLESVLARNGLLRERKGGYPAALKWDKLKSEIKDFPGEERVAALFSAMRHHPEARAELRDELFREHAFSPIFQRPDVMTALGLLDQSLRFTDTHDAALLAGPMDAFSARGARERDPVARGPAKFDAGKATESHPELRVCPDEEIALRLFKHGIHPPWDHRLVRSAGRPTLEDRISALIDLKNVFYATFIAAETEELRHRKDLADGKKPADAFLPDDLRQANLKFRRARLHTDFRNAFDGLRASDPGELLALPLDVLLLADRIDRAGPAKTQGSYFVAKCRALVRHSQLPDDSKRLLDDEFLKPIQAGHPRTAEQTRTDAARIRATSDQCLKVPAQCSPELVDALVMLMSVTLNEWRVLKDTEVASPETLDFRHFTAHGGNRPYLLACARGDTAPLFGDLSRFNRAPVPVAETSWEKPESYRGPNGETVSPAVDPRAPFLIYDPKLGDDHYRAYGRRNVALVEEALAILDRPALSREDFVKYFGPFYEKHAGTLPAADAWSGARAETLRRARHAVIAQAFRAFLAPLDDQSKRIAQGYLLSHPAGRRDDGGIENLLAELLPRPGDGPHDLGIRREQARRWLLEAQGPRGIPTEVLRELTALALDDLDHDVYREQGLVRPPSVPRATAARQRAAEEIEGATRSADARAATEKLAEVFAARGLSLPGDVRREIQRLPDPKKFLADAAVLLRHDPAMLYRHLLQFRGETAGPARERLFTVWSKFTLLPPTSPAAIEENAHRAREAVALLKHPLGDDEVEAVFGDYYAQRTGWSLAEEARVRGFGRAGLLALIHEEAIGIAHLFAGETRLQGKRPPAEAGTNGSPRQVETARAFHDRVWHAETELRGKLVAAAREHWRKSDGRPDVMSALALLILSPTARGQAAIAGGENFEVSESHAKRIGEVLAQLQSARQWPAGAPREPLFALARILEGQPLDRANVERLVAQHFPEDKALGLALADVLRVTRIFGPNGNSDPWVHWWAEHSLARTQEEIEHYTVARGTRGEMQALRQHVDLLPEWERIVGRPHVGHRMPPPVNYDDPKAQEWKLVYDIGSNKTKLDPTYRFPQWVRWVGEGKTAAERSRRLKIPLRMVVEARLNDRDAVPRNIDHDELVSLHALTRARCALMGQAQVHRHESPTFQCLARLVGEVDRKLAAGLPGPVTIDPLHYEAQVVAELVAGGGDCHRDDYADRYFDEIEGYLNLHALDKTGGAEILSHQLPAEVIKGIAGLPLEVNLKLRAMPAGQREILRHALNDMFELMKRELHAYKNNRDPKAARAAKDIQDDMKRVVAQAWAGGTLRLHWRYSIGQASHDAKATGNRAAEHVADAMAKLDKLTFEEREALRDKILEAFAANESKREERRLLPEHFDGTDRALATFLSALEDRGHLEKAHADGEYAKWYEGIRSDGHRVDRFDPKVAYARLKEERARVKHDCQGGPSTANCRLLAEQLKKLDESGFGLGTESRLLYLDSQLLPPDHVGAFARAEGTLLRHAGAGAEAAGRELLYLRIAPARAKIDQVLEVWDHPFHRYLARDRRGDVLTEGIVEDLLKAASSGRVIVTPIHGVTVGQAELRACSDVRAHSKDATEWDAIVNYDMSSARDIERRMIEVAKIVATGRAAELLAAEGKPATEDAVRALATTLLEKITHDVDRALRQVAVTRYLAAAKGHGSSLKDAKLEDPRSPHGCALRALLAGAAHEETVREARQSLDGDLDKRIDIAFSGSPPPDDALVREIQTWGSNAQDPNVRKKAEEWREKYLADHYFGKPDFYVGLEESFTKLVGRHDGDQPVPGLLPETDDGRKTLAREHLAACLDGEKIKLRPLAADAAESVELTARRIHDEMTAVQTLGAVIERESVQFARLVDPTMGSYAQRIRMLSNPDKERPGVIDSLKKSREEFIAKATGKVGSDSYKQTLGDLDARIERAQRAWGVTRGEMLRDQLRLEALLSQPLEGRKTAEEEAVDEGVTDYVRWVIESELKQAMGADQSGAKFGKFPDESFIANLERNTEVTHRLLPFLREKVRSIRQGAPGIDGAWLEAHVEELSTLKARGLVRRVVADLRMQRVGMLREHLVEAAGKQESTLASETRVSYMEDARQCMRWLEARPLGITFPKIGDQYPDAEVQDVAALLVNHQRDREQIEALAKAIQPAKEEDAAQNIGVRRAIDSLRQRMTMGTDTARIPSARFDALLQEEIAKARHAHQADAGYLEETMKALAPMGFKWNGLALTWDDNLDLSRLGSPGMPGDLRALRALLESLRKHGRYARTGTDPWMELIGAIYEKHHGAGFLDTFALGKTVFRLRAPENAGDASDIRAGEPTRKDFLTDMAHAEDYLVVDSLENAAAHGRRLVDEFKTNLAGYEQKRKDYVNTARRLGPDVVLHHRAVSFGLDDFNPVGLAVEVGGDQNAAYRDARAAREKVKLNIDALAKLGGLHVDFNEGDEKSQVQAHALAASFKSQTYSMDDDWNHMLPVEIARENEARTGMLLEVIRDEAILLGASYLTLGAANAARPFVYGARAARAGRFALNAVNGAAQGWRMANRVAIASKAITDVYINLRYRKPGEARLATSWIAAREGLDHSRKVFALAGAVTSSLTAGWNAVGLPASWAPYVVAPVAMAGTGFAVEVADGKDPMHALEEVPHSLLMGVPFGDAFGKLGSRVFFIRKSPVLQRLTGVIGTYGVFTVMGQWRARQEAAKEGKYVNPFTGEEKPLAEAENDLFLDTLAQSSIDVHFALKGGSEAQAAAARSMLRRGYPPAEVRKTYEAPRFDRLFSRKSADHVMQEALGSFSMGEIRELRARAQKTNHESTTRLLDALAEFAGFRGGPHERETFLRFVEKATGGGDRAETLAALKDRIAKMRKLDLVATLRANGGYGLGRFLDNGIFKNEKGEFDPANHHFIPVEYAKEGLLRGETALESALPRIYTSLAGKPAEAAHFLVFLRHVKLAPGDTLDSLAKLHRRAGGATVAATVLQGRLTIGEALVAFPPDAVRQYLAGTTVGELSGRLKDGANPELLRAIAKEIGMEPGLFQSVFERFANGKEGGGAVGAWLAGFGLPEGTDRRQSRKMGDVYAELKGPGVAALIREHAVTKEGMDALVRDHFFQRPENFNLLPIAGLDTSAPAHLEWATVVAKHVLQKEVTPELQNFLRGWLAVHARQYKTIADAVTDAHKAFVARGAEEVARLRREAEAKDPSKNLYARPPVELRAALEELYVNPQLREIIGRGSPHADPTGALANEIFLRLAVHDEATPNGREAYDAALKAARDFPGHEASAGIANAVARAILRQADANAAARLFETLYEAPHGARFLSALEPKLFDGLLARVGGEPKASQLVTLLRDALKASDTADERLPEARRLAALERHRECALIAMRRMPKGYADSVNDHWKKFVAGLHGTASSGGALERRIDRLRERDLSTTLRIADLDPRLLDHPAVKAQVLEDGGLFLTVTVSPRGDAATKRFEQAFLEAAEATVDGDYVAPAMNGGGLEIRFRGVRDKRPGGQKEFVRELLKLVESYQQSP